MTIFSKIIKKEIPSDIVYEDEYVLAFRDISPKAPIHILIIPKIEIDTLNSVDKNNSKYITKIFEAIPKIAKKEGIKDSGYRVVSNCNVDGGQEVYHLHFHILGGRKLDFNP